MDREPAADRALQDRVKTLASLVTAAPKFDATTDVHLWSKNVTAYLDRHAVAAENLRMDVIQDAC